MKKIFYILSLAAAASIALVSCVKEVAPHEPGPADAAGCYGVYFPTQDASGDHVYSPVEEKVLNVTVARTNTQGAITVPVKMTFSEDGIFEVAPVTFADGQEETSFAVRFDKAKEGVNYTGHFVIEDNQYASLYNSGAIGLDFSVLCVEMKQFLNPKTKQIDAELIEAAGAKMEKFPPVTMPGQVIGNLKKEVVDFALWVATEVLNQQLALYGKMLNEQENENRRIREEGQNELRRSRNTRLLDELSETFTKGDVVALRARHGMQGECSYIITRWLSAGLVMRRPDGVYEKVHSS